MKKEFLKALLVIAGAILFNIIFWQEKLAINAILFDAFILWSVFYLYPFSFSNKTVRGLLAAHIITLIAVVIHNTELSKFAFSITLLLMIVFIQYVHRSVWYAAASAMMNFVLMVPTFYKSITAGRIKPIRIYFVNKLIRFTIIPLILLAAFIIIYSSANEVFKNMMGDLGVSLQLFFSKIFDWFNWERFSFLMLGLFITGGLLLKTKINLFSEKDNDKKDDMKRIKTNFKKWKKSSGSDVLSLLMGRFASNNMALKNENSVGIIGLSLLNILLLVINCIDIVYVWFGFNYRYNMDLSDYVHEGTWLLIFSIILAMSVLLFFFRGNLNFYQKNKWLRYGAYGWILQNIILVISVTIRDYYYIVHSGLAYKRMGVLFFLLLVLVGLMTVFYKIYQRKTSYYLLRINAWAVIVLLVFASCIHWDEFIAEYNLARKTTIPLDIKFLLSLSDRTLPVMEQNKDVLDPSAEKILEEREKIFITDQKMYSWLSWNYSDEYVKKHLKPVPMLTAK